MKSPHLGYRAGLSLVYNKRVQVSQNKYGLVSLRILSTKLSTHTFLECIYYKREFFKFYTSICTVYRDILFNHIFISLLVLDALRMI